MTPQEAIDIENDIGELINGIEVKQKSAHRDFYKLAKLATPEFLALYDDKAVKEGLKELEDAMKSSLISNRRTREAHDKMDAALATAKFDRGITPFSGGK